VEEDVDVCGDDAPVTSYPPICIEKETQGRSSKCSNSSSSSDSGSSSSGVYYLLFSLYLSDRGVCYWKCMLYPIYIVEDHLTSNCSFFFFSFLHSVHTTNASMT
jgi:hypothetical protein